MDKTNFSGHHIVFAFVFLTGAILFLWFCWPAVFKGMVNTGNVCGILASAAMMIYGLRFRAVHHIVTGLWQKKPMRMVLIALIVLALVGAALMLVASAAIIDAASKNIPADTPAVVLGCAVKGSYPSRVLQERIDGAYAYMQEHPQAVCVLSGGQGRGEDISEAECMYRELSRVGIDADRMYREAESVNTKGNLENSMQILAGAGFGAGEAVTVISSEFHLYRGRWWAKKLGYQSYGYAAHTDWKYLPTLFLREVIAVVHLWLTRF